MQVAPLILAAGSGFLLAVLWMDLMFDVQVFRYRNQGAELPESVLASIAGYYRRVTTTASPMGHLVGLVMICTLATLIYQISVASRPRWVSLASLVLCAGPILLALIRVLPNAIRLAARSGSAQQQTALARAIWRDHLLCFAAILGFIVLQFAAG